MQETRGRGGPVQVILLFLAPTFSQRKLGADTWGLGSYQKSHAGQDSSPGAPSRPLQTYTGTPSPTLSQTLLLYTHYISSAGITAS